MNEDRINNQNDRPIYRALKVGVVTSEPVAALALFSHVHEEASRAKFGDLNGINIEVQVNVGGFFRSQEDYERACSVLADRLKSTWAFDYMEDLGDKPR